MKRRGITVIAVLMLLAGLALMLYPAVSNYLRNLAFRRVISDYAASVEPMDPEAYARMLDAARSFNQRLAEKTGPLLVLTDEEQEEYDSLLSIDNTGMMGYVSIPKVNINLPIYHGMEERVLQSGAGHLEGSSLPVGGPSTNAVITAHTGLPSAKLFTNIDRLTEGDTFTVRVLKEVLTYEVDEIQVVLPERTDTLLIRPGEDRCMLVTCTPYGINSHRLLVGGHRIPTPPGSEQASNLVEEALGLDQGRLFGVNAELALPVIVVLLVLLAPLAVPSWRGRIWAWVRRLKK